jgi:hypothetical protein
VPSVTDASVLRLVHVRPVLFRGGELRLAFLTPDIVSAIVAGERPNTLTIGALLRDRDIPLSWAEQRRLFGFRDTGDASR